MPLRTRVLRICAWCIAVLLGLFLLLMIWIHAQQWLFRLRAERLMKDYQSIRLHQSAWEDAQALMHRWGAWGHYDGSCTEVNCKYEIALNDLRHSYRVGEEPSPLIKFLYQGSVVRTVEMLGGRYGFLEVGFIVQDGQIRRAKSNLEIHVPHTHFIAKPDDPGDLDLVLRTQSRQSLRESLPRAHWILGGNEQLAEHPTYKVGRPGGCGSCLEAEVTYGMNATSEDILRFTSYNFDCFTSKKCQILEDLLPAAKPWHLYEPPWGLADERRPTPPGSPSSCRTPVWALGRDATAVVAIEALSVSQTKARNWDGHEFTFEEASVRLGETLKGAAAWPPGAQLSVVPYGGDFQNPPYEAAEHLEMKKRFLAILYQEFTGQTQPQPPEAEREAPGFRLDRCGVLEDTPANRAELAKGFAQNDHLRVPEF